MKGLTIEEITASGNRVVTDYATALRTGRLVAWWGKTTINYYTTYDGGKKWVATDCQTSSI